MYMIIYHDYYGTLIHFSSVGQNCPSVVKIPGVFSHRGFLVKSDLTTLLVISRKGQNTHSVSCESYFNYEIHCSRKTYQDSRDKLVRQARWMLSIGSGEAVFIAKHVYNEQILSYTYVTLIIMALPRYISRTNVIYK